jgi:hypothetical protein
MHSTSKLVPRSWMALAIGVIVVGTLGGGCHKKVSGPPPSAKSIAPSPGVSIFPNTPAGGAAGAVVQAARKIGPGAETSYQASLQQLRSNGAEATNVLMAGYRSVDPADYGTRSLLVEILAELGQPETLPALTEIARSPVPPPEHARDDVLNPFVEESVIRLVAVRGIGTFAAGDRQAQDTLLMLLRSDAAPVREEAARALWVTSAQIEDNARREAIRAQIPTELRVDPEKKLGPVGPRGADSALRAATEKARP